MKTVRDFDFQGRKVVVRADLDVPVKNRVVVDDYRLRKAIPTFKLLLKQCSRVVVMGHRGRPSGRDPGLSLRPVKECLEALLNEEVFFVEDCLGEVPSEGLVLLENLRFHAEEEANEEWFAEKLAANGEIFVNESFATSHRAHASTVGVPRFIPGCVGFQFEKELKFLSLKNVEKPLIALLGGAKLKTKLPLIKGLLGRVDKVLIGGAMMFTFYKALNWGTGESMVDEDLVGEASEVLRTGKVVLPVDAAGLEGGVFRIVSCEEIPPGFKGLDVGPGTVSLFKEILKGAKTVLWNGPLGLYEDERFAKASEEVAKFMAGLRAVTIIGGGDTAVVVNKLGLTEKYTHVSTGGGAALKLLRGGSLPAVEALKD